MNEPFVHDERSDRPSLFYLSSWSSMPKGLTAGFTGRAGGVSEGPWRSLNAGLHVGDDDRLVVRNRQKICEAIGWPFEAWTCAEQVHGCEVHRVTFAERGKGRNSREDAIDACDALMTDEPGILLTSFYADCVPLYFHDPVKRVVALAHAGWKGTVLEIAAKTVQAMTEAYGCEPETVKGAIGPAIGACCYEVDRPVLDRILPLIQRLEFELKTSFSNVVRFGEKDRGWINLKEINRQIMIKAGILPINIEITERCTGCNTGLFFSHRVENGNTGRMASWIGMELR
ncbi:peptidoglycan editing factor PgeF [Paenibacillus tarimensis]